METSYKEQLSRYVPAQDPVDLMVEAQRIATIARERNHSVAVWKRCLGAIDLTSLAATDSDRSITEFAGKAARFGIDFPHLPPPASVCVWPLFVDVAGLALGSSRVAITSVSGGFPASQTFIEVKMLETAMAIESGADEIDIVISIGETLDGEYDRMAGTLALLREEVGGETVLKVIVESGALQKPQLIRDASLLAMMAGADFVKSSTGKAGVGATPEAAIVMCTAIRDFYERTGKKVGLKVAGGIKTAAAASLYYTVVEEILGTEWLDKRLFRIGASSLANNLLTAIEGRRIEYF